MMLCAGIQQPHYYARLDAYQAHMGPYFTDAYLLVDNISPMRTSWIILNNSKANGGPYFPDAYLDKPNEHKAQAKEGS